MPFNQKKIFSAFKQMEIKNSLFELKYKSKFAVWDLCRRDILIEIDRILKNEPNEFQYTIKSCDKYKNFFKKFYNYTVLFFLSFKKAKRLVIVFRRFKKKNLSYDFCIDPITSKLSDCFYLDFANSSLLKAIFFRDSSYLSFKIIRKPYKDVEYISKYINDCVSKYFNINFDSKEIINHSLNCFFSGELFFRHLIKNLDCQKVIYSDNGALKSIPYVCSMKNITCFEVQHGATQGSTIYTYPKKKDFFLDKKNCYYPDYYILWGKYWKKNFNLPSKLIVGGTYHYMEKCDHQNKILFISSTKNYLDLSLVAKEVASALPNRKILFKLHPNQFNEYLKIKLDLKNNKNILVVSDEIDNKKLLSESSDFVATRSSLMYQALQSGCRGHILKKNNYDVEKNFFKVTQQFSKSSELLVNLNLKKKQINPVFYEKLSIKSLLNYL